jgi:hypothetical protein
VPHAHPRKEPPLLSRVTFGPINHQLPDYQLPVHASRVTHHVPPPNSRSLGLLRDPLRSASIPLLDRSQCATIIQRGHPPASAAMVCPDGRQPCPKSTATPAFVNSGAAASSTPCCLRDLGQGRGVGSFPNAGRSARALRSLENPRSQPSECERAITGSAAGAGSLASGERLL